MKEILERISKLDPKRLALLAAQLQSRLDAVERARHEPIAIVGMACRFPGGADTPEAFWHLLREGADAVREVPRERWELEALYDPDPDAPGKTATRWGAFLDRVDLFDAPFFGIAPREAAGMDPQQRLLLELAWEALERAAISPEKLMGSSTGVFVGIAGSDYSQLQLRAGLAGMDAYSASGNAHSVAAGRLSFVLGLQGPCFPIDTACSSSLVAVHQAVQSLRAGECRMALAGGVNLILSPETTVALSKLRMMAPDGRCKAFDARADGFVRGEGGALLALKRLSDAEADGDHVVALIRGSAINQDGRSNGLTAPNGPAQEAVIRAALASADLEPERVGYVEAHGTGTALGDPIEVQALAAVLGAGRSEPLPVGSVKANVGHLESAAGIAGLVKLVLALQHREIPPQIHVQSLNPHIPWEELPVTVPTSLRVWESGGTRIGGVSSFGFSGTNAHVIVEEFVERGASSVERGEAETGERPLHLLALSARSETALRELAGRYERHLGEEEVALADVCFSANVGRAHFAHRAALTAGTVEAARAQLRALAVGEAATEPGLRSATGPRAEPSGRPRIAFLFTGQGSQYVNMGRRLFDTQPGFRRALERCEEILRPYLQRPLTTVLYPAPGEEAEAQALLDQTLYTQPALFAFEYALSELWRGWGIEPAAVSGHSVGEYVAACVAGVFSLEEGLRLVAERARLMQAIPAGGAMAAVFAGEEAVARVVAPHLTQLSIAAVNSPEHTVISGAAPVVESVLETLAARGIRSQRLVVSHAFHSPLTNAVLGPFARIAGTVSYSAPRLAMVSNLTGRMAVAADVTDAGYWVRHVRQPVRFAEGMQALHAAGYQHFLEIGPSPTLLAMGRRCIPDREQGTGSREQSPLSQNGAALRAPDYRERGLGGEGLWLPSLRPKRDDWQQMLDSLAALYAAGVEVDWEGFDRDYPRRRLVLPTYPFQRERHWSVPEICWSAAAVPVPVAPPYVNGNGADRLDDLLYEVAWLPAGPAAAGDGEVAVEALPLPAPDEIAARIAPRVAELSAAHGMALYDEMLPRLDSLAAASIAQALHTLGWTFEAGDAVTTGGLAERLGVVARHRRLLQRLLAILAEEGVLRRAGDAWNVVRTPDLDDPAPCWEALRQRFPQFDTELMLVARCAGSLAGVLRGEIDPLQLLFPGGSLDDAEKLYQETPVARTYNALVREAVA
ncbi:MAG: type I polyketide synthase, partial [Longimicrobiaceae bacterium]